MEDENKICWRSFFTGFVIGIFVGWIALLIVGDVKYKRGQVDVLTGEVKYELITKPDSTRRWKLIGLENE